MKPIPNIWYILAAPLLILIYLATLPMAVVHTLRSKAMQREQQPRRQLRRPQRRGRPMART